MMLSEWPRRQVFCDFKALISIKRLLKAHFFVLALCLCTDLVYAKSFGQNQPLGTISVAELPQQGQRVYALIANGGPFAHDKDGIVFGNRERQLPIYKRGYYREYTVRTNGLRNRGARRIVCGGLQVQLPDVCYYTEDHYASFRKIVR